MSSTPLPTDIPASALGALRNVPYMGVIWVVAEAHKRGFTNGHPDWCNLGQGQPEVGPMAGAPERLDSIQMEPADHAYGPLEGTPELRASVAAHYNRLYRKGKRSQYTGANVAVASGGRLALTRAMAALAPGKIGYQNPDYTAYQDMFALHMGRVNSVAVEGRPELGWGITVDDATAAIDEHGLAGFLLSNPCNPTGNLIAGDELRALVDGCRERNCTLLSDEFYSHFIFKPGEGGDVVAGDGPVSAAPFVEDVEQDPILIFDGLTKSYRYPGWRVGWVVGPSAMVEALARTGSSLDGGPSRLSQRAAMQILEPARADQETTALREVFAAKRNEMIRRLSALGVRFPRPSESTFYCWGDLSGLPAPYNDAFEFFWKALDRRVMTVPGPFFDIDPEDRRGDHVPFKNWMRFSFGPPMDNLQLGLSRLEEMLGGE